MDEIQEPGLEISVNLVSEVWYSEVAFSIHLRLDSVLEQEDPAVALSPRFDVEELVSPHSIKTKVGEKILLQSIGGPQNLRTSFPLYSLTKQLDRWTQWSRASFLRSECGTQVPFLRSGIS